MVVIWPRLSDPQPIDSGGPGSSCARRADGRSCGMQARVSGLRTAADVAARLLRPNGAMSAEEQRQDRLQRLKVRLVTTGRVERSCLLRLANMRQHCGCSVPNRTPLSCMASGVPVCVCLQASDMVVDCEEEDNSLATPWSDLRFAVTKHRLYHWR